MDAVDEGSLDEVVCAEAIGCSRVEVAEVEAVSPEANIGTGGAIIVVVVPEVPWKPHAEPFGER